MAVGQSRGTNANAAVAGYRVGVHPGRELTSLGALRFGCSLPNISHSLTLDSTMHRARGGSAVDLRYFCGDSVRGSKSTFVFAAVNGNRSYVIRIERQSSKVEQGTDPFRSRGMTTQETHCTLLAHSHAQRRRARVMTFQLVERRDQRLPVSSQFE